MQHLAVFDYIAVSGTLENRVVEYVDHLHEHFMDPVVVDRGRYRVPSGAGLRHHDETAVAPCLRVPERLGRVRLMTNPGRLTGKADRWISN